MFTRGTYVSPAVAALQNAYEAQATESVSDIVKTANLPIKTQKFHVSVTGTFDDFAANPKMAIWNVNPSSGIHAALMDRTKEGAPVGDLKKCLVHEVTVRNPYSTAPKQVIGFKINPFPAEMLTRDNKPFAGTIKPGNSLAEIPVFTRSDDEINLAQIDLLKLSRQNVLDSIVKVQLPNEATKTYCVTKNTRLAAAIHDPENWMPDIAKQQAAHLKLGLPVKAFKPIKPWDDAGPTSPFITVKKEYYDLAKRSALLKAEQIENTVNPYLTNMFDLEVQMLPIDCGWETLGEHPTIKAEPPVIRDVLMQSPITCGFDLEIRYTLCDGPAWNAVYSGKK